MGMRIKQPYSVNVAAEVAALASFEDLALLRERIGLIVAERERLAVELAKLSGFEVSPSSGNFLLCRLTGVEAKAVHQQLASRGIMVRYFDNALLRNHLRITVGTDEECRMVIEALTAFMASARHG